VLLDSDIFIAIIKEEDRLKQHSLKILKAVEKRKLRNVYASIASVQEIIFWLLNRIFEIKYY
jgi:PIN domain nuclease of toxin-antitoxin system